MLLDLKSKNNSLAHPPPEQCWIPTRFTPQAWQCWKGCEPGQVFDSVRGRSLHNTLVLVRLMARKAAYRVGLVAKAH